MCLWHMGRWRGQARFWLTLRAGDLRTTLLSIYGGSVDPGTIGADVGSYLPKVIDCVSWVETIIQVYPIVPLIQNLR